MELFSQIDDAHGIARYPNGVQKQVKLYQRGKRVYLPHSGGFIEVRAKDPQGFYTTSHPNVKLLEFEMAADWGHERHLGQDNLRLTAALRKAA